MVQYLHHTLLSIDSLLSLNAIYTASHTHIYPVFLYAMLSALHTLASPTLLSWRAPGLWPDQFVKQFGKLAQNWPGLPVPVLVLLRGPSRCGQPVTARFGQGCRILY
jgi:hypothetical protein